MYILENGVERNKQHPDTFKIPTIEEIGELKVDDLVKLMFNENGTVERMWVIVSEIEAFDDGKLRFKGTLDNEPYELKSVGLGDVIEFSSENIISIYENSKNIDQSEQSLSEIENNL